MAWFTYLPANVPAASERATLAVSWKNSPADLVDQSTEDGSARQGSYAVLTD